VPPVVTGVPDAVAAVSRNVPRVWEPLTTFPVNVVLAAAVYAVPAPPFITDPYTMLPAPAGVTDDSGTVTVVDVTSVPVAPVAPVRALTVRRMPLEEAAPADVAVTTVAMRAHRLPVRRAEPPR